MEETTTGNLEAGKLYEKCILSSIKMNINELKINIKTNAVQKTKTKTDHGGVRVKPRSLDEC